MMCGTIGFGGTTVLFLGGGTMCGSIIFRENSMQKYYFQAAQCLALLYFGHGTVCGTFIFRGSVCRSLRSLSSYRGWGCAAE